MGKKVKEYKAGDFIFAKVKGYPAWPARVRGINGKKYFIYFYGTGEIANLPPNMIFDYAENKDKFLTKTVKRKDFNDGVRQIEHDFLNNVPLEEVVGLSSVELPTPSVTDVSTEAEVTMDDTTDTNAADETTNTTPNETTVEDSDEGGPLVIDEGKKRKSKGGEVATPKPVKTVKELKSTKVQKSTPKKDEKKEDEQKKEDEELVSRSGRKIRPKRYADEQTEENSTLPVAKKRRDKSPEKKNDSAAATPELTETPPTKIYPVQQSLIEDLKEPFNSENKENVLIACLPEGVYVGIKLFRSRPTSFKNDHAKLEWERQAAANAIKLKKELEKGDITTQSVINELEMELHLTDEEKAILDKERLIEERKGRMQFLKTEMKLVDLDTKIKACLSLEKADTEGCLKLLEELQELPIKSLMLLKHPGIVESVQRMRFYVGNVVSWALSADDALCFAKQAQLIRKKADSVYNKFKELFTFPNELPFWEFFNERTALFKKCTAKMSSAELLQMVHEPLELSMPTAHTMSAAIEAANEADPSILDDEPENKNSDATKTKSQLVTSTPLKASKRKLNKQDEGDDKKSTEENDSSAQEKTTTDNDSEKESRNDNNDVDKVDDSNDADTSAEKKSEKKANKTANKKGDNPADKRTDKRNEKSVDKTANKTPDKTKEKSVDKTANKTADKTNEKSVDKTANKTADKTNEKSVNKTADQTMDETVEKSVDKKADKIREGTDKEETSGDKSDEPRPKRGRESTRKTESATPKTPSKRKTKS